MKGVDRNVTTKRLIDSEETLSKVYWSCNVFNINNYLLGNNESCYSVSIHSLQVEQFLGPTEIFYGSIFQVVCGPLATEASLGTIQLSVQTPVRVTVCNLLLSLGPCATTCFYLHWDKNRFSSQHHTPSLPHRPVRLSAPSYKKCHQCLPKAQNLWLNTARCKQC